MGEIKKNLFLTFGSVIFTILVLESLSFVLTKIIKKNSSPRFQSENFLVKINSVKKTKKDRFPYKTNREFRLSRPAPYKNSEYFDWFIREEWTTDHPECTSLITHDGKGYNLQQKDTTDCRGYTIINGWRFTTDVPSESNKKVYLLGGSTIQNHEVPNKYTIASFLQRNLNKKGLNIQVNNRGFTTVVTSQQNQFLKKIDLKKGDIVVYYDGANDQWQGVANNRPNGTIIGTNKNLLFAKKVKNNISRLNSYKLLQHMRDLRKFDNNNSTCNLLNEVELEKRSNRSFNEYKKNLLEAKEITQLKGAYFIHFLQPHLFSGDPEKHTLYEKKLINSTPTEMVPHCGRNYLTASSKTFSERHNELVAAGINSSNLSEVLDRSDFSNVKNEYYLDMIHITEKGNKKIANQIFKVISRILDEPYITN